MEAVQGLPSRCWARWQAAHCRACTYSHAFPLWRGASGREAPGCPLLPSAAAGGQAVGRLPATAQARSGSPRCQATCRLCRPLRLGGPGQGHQRLPLSRQRFLLSFQRLPLRHQWRIPSLEGLPLGPQRVPLSRQQLPLSTVPVRSEPRTAFCVLLQEMASFSIGTAISTPFCLNHFWTWGYR